MNLSFLSLFSSVVILLCIFSLVISEIVLQSRLCRGVTKEKGIHCCLPVSHTYEFMLTRPNHKRVS